MPDVEFLTGDASGDDEVLDTRPHRPVPRWLVLVVVLAVVAVLVTVIARHSGRTPTAAAPSPSSSPSSPSSPPDYAPNLPVPPAYTLVGDDAEHRLFAVSGTRLFAFGTNGLPRGSGVTVRLGIGLVSPARLVVDAVDHVLYVIPNNLTGNDAQPPGAIEAFDTRTLHSLGRSPLPAQVSSAAVLDGSLFLTTGRALYRLPSPGVPLEPFGAGRALGGAQLVPDTTRHRLLVVGVARRTTVRVLRFGQAVSGPRLLPDGIWSLAVVGRTIWGSDLRTGRGELAVLDPRTLQPGRNVVRTGSNVVLEGAGRRSLFVTTEQRLQCLAGSSGRVLHNFGEISGQFATAGGRGFLGTISALHPVAMGRCPG